MKKEQNLAAQNAQKESDDSRSYSTDVSQQKLKPKFVPPKLTRHGELRNITRLGPSLLRGGGDD